MVFQDQNFWRRFDAAVPGMIGAGVGLFGDRNARREAQRELNMAQGPEYQAAMNASSGALARAGSMDPQAAAQSRFNQAQSLLSGKDAADEQAVLRRLNATGMLGAGVYNPGVEGITPSGTAMNPQLAAFYAAQNARNARMSYDALNEGEAQTDRMLSRSSRLQQQANAQRQATQQARSGMPSKASSTNELLRGAMGILKETGGLSGLGGMLRGGLGWLGNTTGLWGGPELLNSFGEW